MIHSPLTFQERFAKLVRHTLALRKRDWSPQQLYDALLRVYDAMPATEEDDVPRRDLVVATVVRFAYVPLSDIDNVVLAALWSVVGNDGVIEITLTASSGVDDGIIRLTPKPSPIKDENSLEWTCASASFSTISDATGGVCEYTNQP